MNNCSTSSIYVPEDFFYDDCGGIMRLERIIPMIGQSMRYAYPSKIYSKY